MKKKIVLSLVLIFALCLFWMLNPTAPAPNVDPTPIPAIAEVSTPRPESVPEGAVDPKQEDTTKPHQNADSPPLMETAPPLPPGHTRYELVGSVVTEDGRPIPNARVVYGVLHQPAMETQSGADGTFAVQITAETSQSLVFTAIKAGFLNQTETIFTYQSQQPVVLKLEASYNPTSGRVVDEDQNPLADVKVFCQRISDDGAWMRMTQTNAAGAFSLDLDSQYRLVQFSKPGYRTQTESIPLDQQWDTVIVLKRPMTLEGQVIDDQTEDPVTWFSLWIEGDDAAPIQLLEFNDPEGRFSIPNLSPGGNHKLTFNTLDYAPETLLNFRPTPDDPPLIIHLKRGKQVMRGRVVDSNAQPLEDVAVELRCNPDWMNNYRGYNNADHSDAWFTKPQLVGAAITDDKGYFEIQGLQIEDLFQASMAKAGYATQYQPFLNAWRGSGLVEKVWTLYREGGIRFIIDRESIPEPVILNLQQERPSDFETMVSKPFPPQVTLHPEETQLLFSALPPGRYNVSVRDRKRKLLMEEQVAIGEGEFAEVRLDRLYQIQGTALMNEQPLAHGTVYLHLEQNQWGWSPLYDTTHTDDVGRFTFERIPKGKHSLFATPGNTAYVQNPNVEASAAPVQVTDEDVVDTFYFRKFGSLRVQFVGELPAKPSAISFGRGGRFLKRMGDGVFVGHNLPPGIYTIRDVHAGRDRAPLLEHVAMPEDGSDVDLGLIDLREKGSLRLTFHGDIENTRAYVSLDRAEENTSLIHDRIELKTEASYSGITVGRANLSVFATDGHYNLYHQGELIERAGIEVTIDPDMETTMDIEVRGICTASFHIPHTWRVTQISLRGEQINEVLPVQEQGTSRGRYLEFSHRKREEQNVLLGMVNETPPGDYVLRVDYLNEAGETLWAEEPLKMVKGRWLNVDF